MIPILFDANETSFTTQGLGRLSGALECIVTEERNGSYELEMTYPADGIHRDEIAISRIIYAKPADGKDPQPFRIYKIGKPLNGKCTVQARHISYQLSHIPVMPFTAEGFAAALDSLVTNAAEDCPFAVWTDKSTAGAFKVSVPTSFRALLGGTEGSLLDTFGTAEYEFDKYVIKAHVNRGVDRGVVLRYGKNITDLKQEENIQNTITGICPYWTDRETGACKTLPEKVLWSDRAGNFPYKRTIPVDFSDDFEEQPTDEQLRAAGNSYIERNNIGIPEVSIALSFIPLWQTEEYKSVANLERVNLCDTVTVEFEKLDISATAKVVKTVYDVLKERYRSIEIGDAKTTLAKTIVGQAESTNQKIKDSQSTLEAYISYITEKITGGRGGYVTFNYNADGLPEEMLILDTPSESTATKIIRLNQNGIAFSTDGGATYRTGWTIDGVFNADFIGAGSILATYIKLFGRMSVYTDASANATGGYIGYMSGQTKAGATTNGVAVMSPNDRNFLLVTTDGIRATHYNGSLYCNLGLSGGHLFYEATDYAYPSLIGGDIRLNYDPSSGYNGTTFVNALTAFGQITALQTAGSFFSNIFVQQNPSSLTTELSGYHNLSSLLGSVIVPKGTATAADYDSVTESGIYWINSGVTTANAPCSYWGMLEVFNNGAIQQRFTSYPDMAVYVRQYVNNAWTSWALVGASKLSLWTNGSLSGAFGAQTVAINGLSEYNMFYIEVAFSTNYPSDRSGVWAHVPSASETVSAHPAVMWYQGSTISSAFRICDIDRSAGTVTFREGRYVTGSSNAANDGYAIPVRVIGTKI